MCQKATLYQNAQVNQDMKVLFKWSKKGAISKNWINNLEPKIAATKCKQSKQLVRNVNGKPMNITKLGDKVRSHNEKW